MTKTTAPDWLDKTAQNEWHRILSARVFVLTENNYQAFACYCQSYSRFRAAEEILNAEGTEIVLRDDKGNVKSVVSSPQVGISLKYGDRMNKLAYQLGLTDPRPRPSTSTPLIDQTIESQTSQLFGKLPPLN